VAIQASIPRYDVERFGAAPKLYAEQTFWNGHQNQEDALRLARTVAAAIA
jgi:hypothetical protein